MIEYLIECYINGTGTSRIKTGTTHNDALDTIRLIQANENKPVYQYPDGERTALLVDRVGKWVTLSGPYAVIEVETRRIELP